MTVKVAYECSSFRNISSNSVKKFKMNSAEYKSLTILARKSETIVVPNKGRYERKFVVLRQK